MTNKDKDNKFFFKQVELFTDDLGKVQKKVIEFHNKQDYDNYINTGKKHIENQADVRTNKIEKVDTDKILKDTIKIGNNLIDDVFTTVDILFNENKSKELENNSSKKRSNIDLLKKVVEKEQLEDNMEIKKEIAELEKLKTQTTRLSTKKIIDKEIEILRKSLK